MVLIMNTGVQFVIARACQILHVYTVTLP
jgi:hypothetical protein